MAGLPGPRALPGLPRAAVDQHIHRGARWSALPLHSPARFRVWPTRGRYRHRHRLSVAGARLVLHPHREHPLAGADGSKSSTTPGPRVRRFRRRSPPTTRTVSLPPRLRSIIDPDFQTVSTIVFKDSAGAEQLRYELSYERNRSLRIKAQILLSENQACSTHPDYRLFTDPFSYLDGIHLHTASGIDLDWDFGVFQEQPDPPGEPDGELDTEPKGRIRSLTLPTGAITEYEYDQWVFFYQGLGRQLPNAPGPFLHDVGACAPAVLSPGIGPDPPPGPMTYSTRQPVWAVVDRKVVDTDSRLLEWTEYMRDGLAGVLFNLYEPPFDFANTLLNAPDGGHALLPDPVADPNYRDHFYSGVAVTVVRRHLVVDNQPGAAAEDLAEPEKRRLHHRPPERTFRRHRPHLLNRPVLLRQRRRRNHHVRQRDRCLGNTAAGGPAARDPQLSRRPPPRRRRPLVLHHRHQSATRASDPLLLHPRPRGRHTARQRTRHTGVGLPRRL